MGQVVSLRRDVPDAAMLSKRALANHLGVSTRTIERHVRAGLPSRMIGGRRRFRLQEALAWYHERATALQAQPVESVDGGEREDQPDPAPADPVPQSAA